MPETMYTEPFEKAVLYYPVNPTDLINPVQKLDKQIRRNAIGS